MNLSSENKNESNNWEQCKLKYEMKVSGELNKQIKLSTIFNSFIIEHFR